jgi:hypothetical protein
MMAVFALGGNGVFKGFAKMRGVPVARSLGLIQIGYQSDAFIAILNRWVAVQN